MPNRWSAGIIIPRLTSLLRAGDCAPLRPGERFDTADYCAEIDKHSLASRVVNSPFKMEIGYTEPELLQGAPILATFDLASSIGVTVPSTLYCMREINSTISNPYDPDLDTLSYLATARTLLACYITGNGYGPSDYTWGNFKRNRPAISMDIQTVSGIEAQSIYGCDTVYFPVRPANITPLSAIELAYRYLDSGAKPGRTGLKYLAYLRNSGINTPLLSKIEHIMMRAVKVNTMAEVERACVERNNSLQASRAVVRLGTDNPNPYDGLDEDTLAVAATATPGPTQAPDAVPAPRLPRVRRA